MPLTIRLLLLILGIVSLFTNTLLDETIDYIIQSIYIYKKLEKSVVI